MLLCHQAEHDLSKCVAEVGLGMEGAQNGKRGLAAGRFSDDGGTCTRAFAEARVSLYGEYGYVEMALRYRCLLIYDWRRMIACMCDGLMLTVNLNVFSSPGWHFKVQHVPMFELM